MLRYSPQFPTVAASHCVDGVDSARIDSTIVRRPLSGPPAVALAMLAAMLLLIPAGCGGSKDRPALGQVHGHVTFDGKPLAHAGVVFRPQEVAGRESMGITDDNGEYVLKYIRDDLGAALGKNSVRISTQRSNDPRTETVPERYNKKTTLSRDVKPGDNEIDFPLTSQ